MLASIHEAIKKCFEPAICFDAPYAKVMLDMAVKEVLKVMREPTNDMANEYYKLSQGTEIFYVANWQRSIDVILNEK